MPNRPALARARPVRSKLRSGPWLSASRMRISGRVTSPMGTFSQKIHCQLMPWTTAPPTSGPSATPRPLMADQPPSARPRFSGGTAAERIVSVSGRTSAAPAPCTARAAISASTPGASAAAADAPVKMASPTANIRRRPKRSPSAAPVSSSTANVSV